MIRAQGEWHWVHWYQSSHCRLFPELPHLPKLELSRPFSPGPQTSTILFSVPAYTAGTSLTEPHNTAFWSLVYSVFLRLTHVVWLGTIAHLLTTEYSIVFMDHIFLNHPCIDTQHHCVLNEHVSWYWLSVLSLSVPFCFVFCFFLYTASPLPLTWACSPCTPGHRLLLPPQPSC